MGLLWIFSSALIENRSPSCSVEMLYGWDVKGGAIVTCSMEIKDDLVYVAFKGINCFVSQEVT